MKGYTFGFRMRGSGLVISPAYEEGIYLNYDKAFARLVELNAAQLTVFGSPILDDDDNPITDPEELSRYIVEEEEDPPISFYSIVEIEIHE